MTMLALRHVSVWLDDLAPGDGCFKHALEWARRLNAPLQLVGEATTPACTAACEAEAVAWRSVSGVEALIHPQGLAVFGDYLPDALKQRWLQQSLHEKRGPVLVCPRRVQPMDRVVVVVEPGDVRTGFLDAAADLCQVMQATPVVLAVARSSGAARPGQQAAQERFAARRLPAYFDFVIGDRRSAVVSIARWRRCSHVVLARRQATSWWRRFRGDTLSALLETSDALAFLALPEEIKLTEIDAGRFGDEPTEEVHCGNGTRIGQLEMASAELSARHLLRGGRSGVSDVGNLLG